MTLLIALYYIIACTLATAVASALHGGDHVSKAYIVAVHCLLFPISAPLFWVLFRRRAHAQAELKLLDGGDYEAVEKAYYIKPLGKFMARVMRYCMETPWPEFGAVTIRRQQELVGGLMLGLRCSLTIIPFAVWFI